MGNERPNTGSKEPSQSATEDATSVTFTYTGAYEPLLRHLLEYEILDLSIEEAPLEDIFLRFYGEDPAKRVEAVENGAADREGEGADV